MRILGIGIHGIPGSVNSDLLHANVFEDHDVVVVDPCSLLALYGNRLRLHNESHHDSLDKEAAARLDQVNAARRKQVRGLINKNGIVICLLQPLLTWEDATRRRGITNYDWLFDVDEVAMQFGEIKYGAGTTFDYVDRSHPLGQYLVTKPHWTAYIEGCNPDKWRILASAFDTHLLAIAGTTETGHIILLPSGYDVKRGELLEQCIRQLVGEEYITPAPEWAQCISVPGQDAIADELDVVNTQVNALVRQQESLVSRNAELESWKWLLYETGKHQLEPIVHKALALLGCKVEPQPDGASDGKVESEFGVALLEIEGAEETVKLDKVSQLLRNIADSITEEEGTPKGILIGNPFRREELANRPPKGSQKKLFSDHVIRTAERQNISVLLSADLYDVVCLILDNKLSDRQIEALRKLIFEGKGLVRLSVR